MFLKIVQFSRNSSNFFFQKCTSFSCQINWADIPLSTRKSNGTCCSNLLLSALPLTARTLSTAETLTKNSFVWIKYSSREGKSDLSTFCRMTLPVIFRTHFNRVKLRVLHIEIGIGWKFCGEGNGFFLSRLARYGDSVQSLYELAYPPQRLEGWLVVGSKQKTKKNTSHAVIFLFIITTLCILIDTKPICFYALPGKKICFFCGGLLITN